MDLGQTLCPVALLASGREADAAQWSVQVTRNLIHGFLLQAIYTIFWETPEQLHVSFVYYREQRTQFEGGKLNLPLSTVSVLMLAHKVQNKWPVRFPESSPL